MDRPIAVHTKERKDVPLAFEEVQLLTLAMEEFYLKTLRQVQRQREIRNKKSVITLGQVQELVQYMAYVERQWKENKWQDSTSS
jgi:hypothetical protein